MAIFRYKLTQTRSCEITIIAKDKESADETINKETFENMCDNTIKIEDETAQFIGMGNIIDPTNGHNETLVELINKAYYYANADFMTIVGILAERYKDEIQCYFTETFTPKDYAKQNVHEFLTDVCDDMDLRTIISWCRMSIEEN